jgi:hypothetical protein
MNTIIFCEISFTKEDKTHITEEETQIHISHTEPKETLSLNAVYSPDSSIP